MAGFPKKFNAFWPIHKSRERKQRHGRHGDGTVEHGKALFIGELERGKAIFYEHFGRGQKLAVVVNLALADVRHSEVALHADIEDEGQTVSYAYPDLPLPPTGGDEPEKPAEPEADEPEPTRVARTSRLAQTGDESLTVICLVALLAVAGAGAAFVAYRKRR